MRTMIKWCFVFLLLAVSLSGPTFGSSVPDSLSLYPKPTETRQTISLNGVWNFKVTDYSLDKNAGFTEKWYNKLLNLDQSSMRMPVPSSFNDITESRMVRDFAGWSWYDRMFFVPKNWNDGDILLRFGSVNYEAKVYVNGQLAMEHIGGHLPFQTNVTKHLKFGSENHITVAVNNELSSTTIPQGHNTLKNDSRVPGAKFMESSHGFDFFNYAGIQRSVTLYYVPTLRISDITIITEAASADNEQSVIEYHVKTNVQSSNGLSLQVQLFDREGVQVAEHKDFDGKIVLSNAKLWWPFTMHENPGYLYKIALLLYSSSGDLLDSYHQNVGIRSIKVSNGKFLINGKPFYFRGFGRHEEYNIRGRALDEVMILKDFSLIRWIGANSFRTSHYPYSEELMDEADAQGIVVIDECPAVSLSDFNEKIESQHKTTVREMIDRDKNRPSVFMWSIANEPVSSKSESGQYFKNITGYARKLDISARPITGAVSVGYNTDHMAQSLDVIMVNRYFSWYSDTGHPQVIQHNLVSDIENFYNRFKKLLLLSEYGADTIAGMHSSTSFVFSEDFQCEALIEYHKAFDTLKSKGFFIGEHVWNFADFATDQGLTRVGGNKKGIFTRERNPKASARLLRCRYWALADIKQQQHEGFSYCPSIQY